MDSFQVPGLSCFYLGNTALIASGGLSCVPSSKFSAGGFLKIFHLIDPIRETRFAVHFFSSDLV